MKLPQPLYPGELIQRYKRFLADVRLNSGEIVTAHCPNSGGMRGCSESGSQVLLSKSSTPGRKLRYTWELVKTDNIWVGINTIYPNRLVYEGIENGVITELQGYDSIRREVRYGMNSRVDLLLENKTAKCYVEVKNVTLVDKGQALFPDAVTLRGQKHLLELMKVVRQGNRAVVFFVVQREDGHSVAPADHIDPEYGQLFRKALAHGVEMLGYRTKVTERTIQLERKLPVYDNSDIFN